MKNIRPLLLIFGLIFISTTISAQEITADLSYYPKVEYNDKIVESNTYKNGTTFEKVVIDGFDSKIPFYVIKPKNKKDGKFVILLHGITQSKDNWIKPLTSLSKLYIKLKDSLLTLGYSVIIPDAKYHGERSYEANFTSPWTFYTSHDSQKLYNMYSTTVKDIRIIMDYMQEYSNNKPMSFDIIGYSMGGQLAIFLNSVDNRLNRVIACAIPLDTQKGLLQFGMNEEKAKRLEVIFLKNYAFLQKAPISLLMGTKDWWSTKEEVQVFFNKINLIDKTLKFYESGHSLPIEFVSDAIENITKE